MKSYIRILMSTVIASAAVVLGRASLRPDGGPLGAPRSATLVPLKSGDCSSPDIRGRRR